MREPKRFWCRVQVGKAEECWEWQAGKAGRGYGRFWINKTLKNWAAHRVAWVLTYGPIPEGLFVCHHCDNPSCCNPYHLFLGTRADNMRDAARKGRLGKLSIEEVREIRSRLEEGASRQELADEFGVSKKSIGNIRRGSKWGWLT